MTHRMAGLLFALTVGAAAVGAASNGFTSTWKSPDAGPMNFAGRKVAALVIAADENLRMSAEEALAREISARGPKAEAAYRMIPREELADKTRAQAWCERVGIEGVVAMRIVSVDTQKVYSTAVFGAGYYANVWDYYGYGWATVYPIGEARKETTIAVETVLFDVRSGSPMWAGVSRATNPKNVATFMKDLTRDIVRELQKEGLASKGSR